MYVMFVPLSFILNVTLVMILFWFNFLELMTFLWFPFTLDVATHTANLTPVVLPVMTSIIHYNFSAFDFY